MYSRNISILFVVKFLQLIGLFVIITQIEYSSGECCYSHGHKCCGFIKCDILCCNCDGGCKRTDDEGTVCRTSMKNYTFSTSADMVKYSPAVDVFFHEVDTNKDGKLTKAELDAFALYKFPGRTNADELYSFDDMDKKHKGFLTPEDVDVDYHKYLSE